MDSSLFRKLYPEYSDLSDDDIVYGLREKYPEYKDLSDDDLLYGFSKKEEQAGQKPRQAPPPGSNIYGDVGDRTAAGDRILPKGVDYGTLPRDPRWNYDSPEGIAREQASRIRAPKGPAPQFKRVPAVKTAGPVNTSFFKAAWDDDVWDEPWAKGKKKGISYKLKDIKERPQQMAPYLSGIADAEGFIELGMAIKRAREDNPTPRDVQLIKRFSNYMNTGEDWWFKVGDLVAAQPKFWGELMTTGGVYTAGRKIGQEAVEAGIKAFMKKEAPKILEKWGAKALKKVAGVAVGGTLQSIPAQATTTLANVARRQLPQYHMEGDKLVVDKEGESISSALAKSFTDSAIQTFTEHSGAGLPGLGKLAKKAKWVSTLSDGIKENAMRSALVSSIVKMNKGASAVKIKKFMADKMAFNGTLEEMFEERVGDWSSALASTIGLADKPDRPFNLPTLDQLSVEFVGFLIPNAGATGLGYLSDKIRQQNAERKNQPPVRTPSAPGTLPEGSTDATQPPGAPAPPQGAPKQPPAGTMVPGGEVPSLAPVFDANEADRREAQYQKGQARREKIRIGTEKRQAELRRKEMEAAAPALEQMNAMDDIRSWIDSVLTGPPATVEALAEPGKPVTKKEKTQGLQALQNWVFENMPSEEEAQRRTTAQQKLDLAEKMIEEIAEKSEDLKEQEVEKVVDGFADALKATGFAEEEIPAQQEKLREEITGNISVKTAAGEGFVPLRVVKSKSNTEDMAAIGKEKKVLIPRDVAEFVKKTKMDFIGIQEGFQDAEGGYQFNVPEADNSTVQVPVAEMTVEGIKKIRDEKIAEYAKDSKPKQSEKKSEPVEVNPQHIVNNVIEENSVPLVSDAGVDTGWKYVESTNTLYLKNPKTGKVFRIGKTGTDKGEAKKRAVDIAMQEKVPAQTAPAAIPKQKAAPITVAPVEPTREIDGVEFTRVPDVHRPLSGSIAAAYGVRRVANDVWVPTSRAADLNRAAESALQTAKGQEKQAPPAIGTRISVTTKDGKKKTGVVTGVKESGLLKGNVQIKGDDGKVSFHPLSAITSEVKKKEEPKQKPTIKRVKKTGKVETKEQEGERRGKTEERPAERADREEGEVSRERVRDDSGRVPLQSKKIRRTETVIERIAGRLKEQKAVGRLSSAYRRGEKPISYDSDLAETDEFKKIEKDAEKRGVEVHPVKDSTGSFNGFTTPDKKHIFLTKAIKDSYGQLISITEVYGHEVGHVTGEWEKFSDKIDTGSKAFGIYRDVLIRVSGGIVPSDEHVAEEICCDMNGGMTSHYGIEFSDLTLAEGERKQISEESKEKTTEERFPDTPDPGWFMARDKANKLISSHKAGSSEKDFADTGDRIRGPLNDALGTQLQFMAKDTGSKEENDLRKFLMETNPLQADIIMESILPIIRGKKFILSSPKSEGGSPLRGNIDYALTLDFDTKCPKQINFRLYDQAVFGGKLGLKGIQTTDDYYEKDRRPGESDEHFEKRFLKDKRTEERWGIVFSLSTAGVDAPCPYCYVEAKRFSKAVYGAAGGVTNIPKDFAALGSKTIFNLSVPNGLINTSKATLFNMRAGLRCFSSTDMKPSHVLDLVKAIAQAQGIALKMHAFTKTHMLIDGFGEVGIKINASVFPKMINGKMVFDPAFGLEEEYLDKAYKNPAMRRNVSGMAMATSDEIIESCGEDKRIGLIVPFHASGLKKNIYEALGWTDYTEEQKEHWDDNAKRNAAKDRVASAISELRKGEAGRSYDRLNPAEKYWVDSIVLFSGLNKKRPNEEEEKVLLTSDEFAELYVPYAIGYSGFHGNSAKKYAELCLKYGVTQKLERFKNKGWYFKLITDIAAWQSPHTPPDVRKINMKALESVIRKYEEMGGDKFYDKMAVNNNIARQAQKFIEELRAGKTFPEAVAGFEKRIYPNPFRFMAKEYGSGTFKPGDSIVVETQEQLNLFPKTDTSSDEAEKQSAEVEKKYGEYLDSLPAGVLPGRKLKRIDYVGRRVKNADDVAELLKLYRDPKAEHFHVIFMRNGRIQTHNVLSSGAGNYVRLETKRIIRFANVANKLKATKVFIAHNHPAGSERPSQEDIHHTKTWIKIFGKNFGGHIVMGDSNYSVIEPEMGYPALAKFVPTNVRVSFFSGTSEKQEKTGEIKDFDSAVKFLDPKKGKFSILFFNARGNIVSLEDVREDANVPQYIKERSRFLGDASVIIGGDQKKLNALVTQNRLPASVLDVIAMTVIGEKRIPLSGRESIKTDYDKLRRSKFQFMAKDTPAALENRAREQFQAVESVDQAHYLLSDGTPLSIGDDDHRIVNSLFKGEIPKKYFQTEGSSIGNVVAFLGETGAARIRYYRGDRQLNVQFIQPMTGNQLRAIEKTNAKLIFADRVNNEFEVISSQLFSAPEEMEDATAFLSGSPKFMAKDQTKTPAFKMWFGKSKVVDADGKPLVVYHGARGSFKAFRENSWFAEDPTHANIYATNSDDRYDKKSNVMPAYINIKNPLDITSISLDGYFDQGEFNEKLKGFTAPPMAKGMGWDIVTSQYFIDKAKSSGYDGLVAIEAHPKTGLDSKTYLVFSPTQIKSAIGNRGTFDAKNPDIRFSVRDRIETEKDLTSFAGETSRTPEGADEIVSSVSRRLPLVRTKIPLSEFKGRDLGGRNDEADDAVIGRVAGEKNTNRIPPVIAHKEKGKWKVDDGVHRIYGLLKNKSGPKEVDAFVPESDVRFSIRVTPEQDAAYMKAAESGDTKTAQRMVDEAAKKAGYAKKAYHATSSQFNKFKDMDRLSEEYQRDAGRLSDSALDKKWPDGDPTNKAYRDTGEKGIYFSDEPDEFYGRNVKSVYLKYKNPISERRFRSEFGGDVSTIWKKDYEALRREGIDAIEGVGQTVVFDPEQIKSLDPITKDNSGRIIPLSERFNPKTADIRFMVKPETADKLKTEVSLPKHPAFESAVKNTKGAEITERGLLVEVERRQKEEQGGETSVRTGVFYQPSGSLNKASYSGKGWYGGSDKFNGETLLKKPLFAKGATGGKAVETAYDFLNGKGSYERLRGEILKEFVTNLQNDTSPSKIAGFLADHGASDETADDISYAVKRSGGNNLVYALLENIVAHSVRKAGYDSILGWSMTRDKRPFLSEIFDVREITYPQYGSEEGRIHDEFRFMSKDQPVWYSTLRRVIEQKMPNRASVEDVKRLLGPQSGVKQDELKWTGLQEFLDSKTGMVTKQEVLDATREVEVKEVVLGGKPNASTLGVNYTDAGWSVIDDGGNVIRSGFESEDQAYDSINEIADTRYGEGTKFHQYQLPGGENYRELLLTLPNVEGGIGNRDEVVADLYPGKKYSELTPGERKQVDAYVVEESGVKLNKFQSTHYPDHQNIVAHVRFNDRADVDGKRVLFLEEVQSDWHQKGREQGYSKEVTRESAAEMGFSIYRAESNLGKEVYFMDGPSERRDIPATGWDTEAEAWRGVLEFVKNKVVKDAVPSAPFSKTWHEMVMRRMLRWAAENGYDKVAWTTGEQQAERYDLSKQIDRLQVWKKSNGMYDIRATKGGRELVSDTVPEAKLSETIGKELAKKVISGEGAVPAKSYTDKAEGVESSFDFSGLNLRVGGEGMAGFYDKILPEYMNKYGKKWGAKVEGISIPKISSEDQKGLKNLGAPGLHEGSAPVHSVSVTPAMRESVMQGQPKFMARNQTETPEFKEWFRGSKVVDADGKPLVLYHGTKNPPTKFSKKRIGAGSTILGDYETDRFGIFATPSVGLATEFAGQGGNTTGSSIMPVFMHIADPFDMTKPYSDALFNTIESYGNEHGMNGFRLARDIGDMWGSWKLFDKGERVDTEVFIKMLDDMGYDGAKIYEPGVAEDSGGGISFVAFDPSQVKSATGNRGTFDAKNPDIRFMAKGQMSREELEKRASKLRERGFITTVKAKAPGELADRVAGQYIPRETDELMRKAVVAVGNNPLGAENFVKTDKSERMVATSMALVDYYSGKATVAEAMGRKSEAESMWEKSGEIAEESAERLTELGRAIQAASIYGRLTPQGIIMFAARAIKRYNANAKGWQTKASPMNAIQKAQLAAKATKISQMPDGQDKALAWGKLQMDISKMIPSPLIKKIINVWKAGLLTAPPTHLMNTGANLMHGVGETLKDIPATMLDVLLSAFTGKRSTTMTLRGTMSGAKQGLDMSKAYWHTGVDLENAGSKLDAFQYIYFGDKPHQKLIQGYVDGVFRLLGMEDKVFFWSAYNRSMYSQANVAAMNANAPNKEAFIQNFIKNAPEEAVDYAVHDAEVAVFRNKTFIGQIGSSIQKAGGSQLGHFVIPFSRTPSAVAMQMYNYSPLGLPTEIVRSIKNKKLDQRALSQAFGRSAVGTVAILVGIEIFKAGLMALTPDDDDERRQWNLEGKKQNTIFFGGKWRNPNILGPLGNTLMMGGYFAKALVETGSFTAAVIAMSGGGAATLKDQTFLRGLSSTVDFLNDPNKKAITYGQSQFGSVVPTIVANIAASMDRTPEGELQQRELHGILDGIYNRTPWIRERLEPQISVLGHDVSRGANLIEVMSDPTRPSRGISSFVIDELKSLNDAGYNATPSYFGGKKGFKGIPPEQNTELERKAGKYLEASLIELFNDMAYKELDSEVKVDEIDKRIKASRLLARAEFCLTEISNSRVPSQTESELETAGVLNNTIREIMAQLSDGEYEFEKPKRVKRDTQSTADVMEEMSGGEYDKPDRRRKPRLRRIGRRSTRRRR